jgi:hypothetical protein
VATYALLFWQIAFPAFAWRRGLWRVVLLGGAAVGFVWLTFIVGDPMFGPTMLVFSLAYLTPAEWHWVRGLFGQLPGLARAQPASTPHPARRGAAAGSSALATPR